MCIYIHIYIYMYILYTINTQHGFPSRARKMRASDLKWKPWRPEIHETFGRKPGGENQDNQPSISMGWLKGKSTGNQRFSHEIWEFPVIFPLNQSIDMWKKNLPMWHQHMESYGIRLLSSCWWLPNWWSGDFPLRACAKAYRKSFSIPGEQTARFWKVFPKKHQW